MSTTLQATAQRRAIPLAQVSADAAEWCVQWWDEVVDGLDEPVDEALHEVVMRNAAHYAVWGRVGAKDGDGPGFLALHRFAIRDARGSVEKGTETASETWIDIRGRLEQTVARSLKGRSVPDFLGPNPEGEQNVHRYHVIQARLRNANKWSKRKAEEVYEDTRYSAEWTKPYRAAEARTYAVPLHFASWWTLLDLKERRTRDGRVKGRMWWWQMLLHALDVQKVEELGGDRNDPTEALLRLRLRFTASQGLAGWLRRLGADHAYWRQVEFGLPDPENVVAAQTVREALDQLKPVLSEEIDRLDVTEEEAKALKGTLIRGENVRTSIKAMTGDDANARQERFIALADQAGRAAGDRLTGGGGGSVGGGGGGGGHRHADALMNKLSAGAPPSMDEVMLLQTAVAECAHCRERWLSTVEAPAVLPAVARALSAEPAHRSTGRGRAVGGVLAFAAAATLAVFVGMPDAEPDVGLRGVASTPPVHLDLFVVPGGGQNSERFAQDRAYAQGDTLYFRVSADQPAEVAVSVTGPEGREALGVQSVSSEMENLGVDGAATWYRFDAPGSYVVQATSGSGESACEPPSCVRREIEVH